jgi:hypothetical protein
MISDVTAGRNKLCFWRIDIQNRLVYFCFVTVWAGSQYYDIL